MKFNDLPAEVRELKNQLEGERAAKVEAQNAVSQLREQVAAHEDERQRTVENQVKLFQQLRAMVDAALATIAPPSNNWSRE